MTNIGFSPGCQVRHAGPGGAGRWGIKKRGLEGMPRDLFHFVKQGDYAGS